MRDVDSSADAGGLKALSAANLAADFATTRRMVSASTHPTCSGAKVQLARYGVRALYDAILETGDPTALAAYQRWRALFGKTCGHDPAEPPGKLARLAQRYGVTAAELQPEAMLFALHTYYALVVRLLVGQVLACSQGLPLPVEGLLRAESGERLRGEMADLEAGGTLSGLDVVDVFHGDPFSWYLAAWSAPIECTVRRLAACLADYDPRTVASGPHGGDLLKQLYQELLPRPLRHRLGEYYTPDWLAGHVLDQAGYTGQGERRLLDPACGSGTFLMAAIKRIRAAAAADDEAQLCRRICANVVGFDLSPLAVMAARANYLIAIRDLLPRAGRVEIPVYFCDSILDGPGPSGRLAGGFDYVVGNPPWITWDNLPEDYRQATKPLWQRYGLFSLSGLAGRHGGGKKDLSMLMLYTAADRYLKHGGRLAMVITQTLFQTKGAGDGFRRFRLGPEGEWLKVLRVDDLTALRPFPGAANSTSTILLEKGAQTQYPVPYVKWLPSNDGGQPARQMYWAEPIAPASCGSPWFLRPEAFEASLDRLVGPSDYVAHLGANSGGANGVYWLEILGEADGGVRVQNIASLGKRRVEVTQQVIEPDLLYPLVRWADVTRWHAWPSAYILLTQDVASRKGIDEDLMQRRYPRTYAYLRRHERLLRSRAAYRRYQADKAFYSMYNVGSYTVAPIKVVWRRMDRRLCAAVVEAVDGVVGDCPDFRAAKMGLSPSALRASIPPSCIGQRPVVPQETCVLIAAASTAEAHYICAVLNSSAAGFLVAAHSVQGGKGFGTPSILDFLNLRRFDAHNPLHVRLAAHSRQAHQLAASGQQTDQIEPAIDGLAAKLWGLRPM